MSTRPSATPATTVWLGPSATSFSCLCETCLETARTGGALFSDALRLASVRGDLAPETQVAVARCAAGHEIVLRRVELPPRLTPRDQRQLQLT